MKPENKIRHQRMPLEKLVPHPKNARKIQPRQLDALRASIREFGLVQPIIWNSRSGYVVGGHQRLRIMSEDGETEADVIVVDLDDAREEALRLVLNNPGAQGKTTADVNELLRQLNEEEHELYASLNLEALEMSEPQPVDLVEIDTTEGEFVATIRGPIPSQPEVLDKLRAALEQMEGVDVEIITTVL